jgi:hypothetical protein
MQLHKKDEEWMVYNIKRKPLNPIIRNLKIIFSIGKKAYRKETAWIVEGMKKRRRRMNNEMPSSI